MHEFTVTEDADIGRFVLARDGEMVGYASFREQGAAVVVPHVETLHEYRGQGYADRLMEGIIERLRASGRTIVPLCPFAATYLRDHPEHGDLLQQR